MKRILLLATIFCALEINAQNIYITFVGSGGSTTVGNVKIENLIAGTSLTLNGNDILHLTGITGINQHEKERSAELIVFPNPSAGSSRLKISVPSPGNAVIAIYDITGKQVASIQSYLENSVHEFQLSGLNNGLYMISVEGKTYHYTGKLLSNSNTSGNIIGIERISSNQSAGLKHLKNEDKGAMETVNMAYSTGDRLKFTGISGIYSTVITDIPSSDKIITFNFIACTDGDVNNYPVVVLGSQVWMAENLKTTKYRDNTDIPNVTDNTAWSNLTADGYCWYNNEAVTYKDIYGALYNWYAVNTGKLCPTGWHVPNESDFLALVAYLGGASNAGGKLKETGNAHWAFPNTGATNETGFTGLPGGYRLYSTGGFTSIGYYGIWWSALQYSATTGGAGIQYYNSSIMDDDEYNKKYGFSVRCLRD
jgi:uncharacterized protein (TIGR02145 family)